MAVTTVTAAARVPRSSTSARARCRMRPSAFSGSPPVNRLSRSGPGANAGPSPSAFNGSVNSARYCALKRGSSTVPSRRRNARSRQASAGGSPASASTATKSSVSVSPYGSRTARTPGPSA